jgi:hypothetical protein
VNRFQKYVPLFLLAYFGLFVTWRYREKQLLIVYIVIALTLAENLAFWGNMRFRAPIEPFSFCLQVVFSGGSPTTNPQSFAIDTKRWVDPLAPSVDIALDC